MPWGLKRFQECRDVHFLTFSCYRRKPNLVSETACRTFLDALERVRDQYQICVYGYVIMPEHVHMLVNEPEHGTLAQVMQSLKQGVARRLSLRAAESFWQARYYDFNVWSHGKFVEKLRYIHRNPVRRGLVARPEDWPWSSYRHYANCEAGVVEIESQWTARKREWAGVFPTVKLLSTVENPNPRPTTRPSKAWTGQPLLESGDSCQGTAPSTSLRASFSAVPYPAKRQRAFRR